MDSIKDMKDGEIKKILQEIIKGQQEFTERAINMAMSARQEILILCGTKRVLATVEELEHAPLTKHIANEGVEVRLLIPASKGDSNEEIRKTPSLYNIRTLESSLQNEMFIMLVDRRQLLLCESRTDEDATGRVPETIEALYSDLDPIVTSYHQIFESIWRHVKTDDELIKSRNDLGRMAEELEFLFESLAESNKDLLAANERLAANDQMQKEFINIAAHELRTPIQPILGVANIFESQFESSGKETIEVTKPEIDMIIRNAKRLERLSSVILEVARIDSDSLKLDRELLKLYEVIETIIQDVSKHIEDLNDLRFECQIPKDIFIYADKERINQVLYNLLDNAIKFTKKGLISVNATVENNRVKVQVSDTGNGIDPKIMHKLFTKFTTKSDKGTGLGLYISKNIIEAHGGMIWAENNKDGKGATFTFTLPSSN